MRLVAALALVSMTKGVLGLAVHDLPLREVFPTWHVEVRSGESISVTGTVQDVHRRLAELNPGWEAEAKARRANDSGVERRGKNSGWPADANIVCSAASLPGDGEPGIWTTILSDAINYLSNAVSSPVSGPGPGTCNRVSCEWDTAVWWCNDRPRVMVMPDITWISDGLRIIKKRNACHEQRSAQIFNPSSWNVIIGGGINGQQVHC